MNNTSNKLRNLSVDFEQKRILMSKISGSLQEKDLTLPPNCNGLGRIRHFRRKSDSGWIDDPLPIDPACKSLDLQRTDLIHAQVFQVAACDWRCWFCFVPYDLLSANPQFAQWVSPSELVDLYLAEKDRPLVIDISGGSPTLVPEIVPWIIQELTNRNLKVYLWSDDNLSNYFFWEYLSEDDIELISSYKNYGRVCCFKGFNTESFAFNTNASSSFFNQQFDIIQRLLSVGIDLYAYVILTTPQKKNIQDNIKCFVDELQKIDKNLPLKVIPLEIRRFTPVNTRATGIHMEALQNQWIALEAWKKELESRFSYTERHKNIAEIKMGN